MKAFEWTFKWSSVNKNSSLWFLLFPITPNSCKLVVRKQKPRWDSLFNRRPLRKIWFPSKRLVDPHYSPFDQVHIWPIPRRPRTLVTSFNTHWITDSLRLYFKKRKIYRLSYFLSFFPRFLVPLEISLETSSMEEPIWSNFPRRYILFVWFPQIYITITI